MSQGVIEVLSTEFAIGWARSRDGKPAHVYATLNGAVIGITKADLMRADLMEAPPVVDAALSMMPSLTSQIADAEGATDDGQKETRRAFIIMFDSPVAPDAVNEIEVHAINSPEKLTVAAKFRTDAPKRQQIFVLGSPRSGTSELAATLTRVLALPWLGEGHAGPAFKKAADALSGDANSSNELLRFMATQSLRDLAKDSMRSAYYYLHSSSSFVDKTPGVDMINAASFLSECFPEAKFIYLKRNGISNVLSRMAKFGGRFDEHCADWAAAMNMWDAVKEQLPHYLEVEQELMQDFPDIVAVSVANYLDVRPDAKEISASLRSGSRERTGAGIGRASLAATGWSEAEKAVFRTTCGEVMKRHSYAMD